MKKKKTLFTLFSHLNVSSKLYDFLLWKTNNNNNVLVHLFNVIKNEFYKKMDTESPYEYHRISLYEVLVRRDSVIQS